MDPKVVGSVAARPDHGCDFELAAVLELLLLEFVAYGARNSHLAERNKDHKRQLKATLAEILEEELTARGITPPMPIDQLAMTLTGLANGLAVEELSDPGSMHPTNCSATR